MKTILLLCIIFGFSHSCKNTEKNVQSAHNNASSSAQKPIIVSFYSIGSGIDYERFESFKSWLDASPYKKEGKISFKIIAWGREGEKDFCIILNSKNNNEKDQLIQSIRSQLANAEHVHIIQDQNCKEQTIEVEPHTED
jgi:hypothetical protein